MKTIKTHLKQIKMAKQHCLNAFLKLLIKNDLLPNSILHNLAHHDKHEAYYNIVCIKYSVKKRILYYNIY